MGTPVEDLLEETRGKPKQKDLDAALYKMTRPPAFSSVGPLEELAFDKRNAIRNLAVQALGNCSSPDAERILRRVLREATDPYCLRYANAALGRVGTKAAMPELLTMLDHSVADVKTSALAAIGKIAGASQLDTYVRMLEEDRSAKWTAMRLILAHGNTSAVEPVLARVKAITKSKRSIGQLPKSELILGLEYLAKFAKDDPRVIELFRTVRAHPEKLFNEERKLLEETPELSV